MTKKIDLGGSHVIAFAEKVSAICRPLQDLMRIGFRYGRVYPDGSRIILTTGPEAFQYFYGGGKYLLSWYDNINPMKRSSIWAIEILFLSKEAKEMEEELGILFNWYHGINLVHHCQNFYEIFSLASDNLHLYDIKYSIWDLFKFYFREQAKDLIEAAGKEKIFVPQDQDSSEVRGIDELKFTKSTGIKRYYLSGLYHEVYLTDREVECLNWNVRTKSAVETSKILHISRKTVERHIDNIKKKLHLEKQSQLISFAIEQGLVFE